MSILAIGVFMKKILICLMLAIATGKVFAAEEITCSPLGKTRYNQITLTFAETPSEQSQITMYTRGGEESGVLKIKKKSPGYVEFEMVGEEDEGQIVLAGSILSIFSDDVFEQYRCYE